LSRKTILAWILSALGLSTLIFVYERRVLPAPSVHIRWAPGVDERSREELEQRFELTDGEFREGRTWAYRIRNVRRGNVEALLKDSRVEDTDGIDPRSLRVAGAPALLEGLLTALVLGFGASTLVFVGWTLRRNARSTSHEDPAGLWRGSIWIAVPILVATVIAVPYIAIGPDDFEEYVTGVTATKLAVDAIVHGSSPLWSVDLGLGVPLPLRYHFITHPLSPLCAVADCQVVLRFVTSIHLLVGAAFMAMLAMRFTGNRLLASAAGVTYCLSSGVAQLMLTDDWPITAINESTIPILLYATFSIDDAKDWRGAAVWSLVLGGVSGLMLSMSFAVVTLAIVGLVALSAPGLRRRLPWLILAAVIQILIGGAQVYHIYEEFVRTPSTVARTFHGNFSVAVHLWSAFLRPFFSDPHTTWRTVFFGPPFAAAAVFAFLTSQDAKARPLRVGLLLGLLGFIVPPSWLLNINTALWSYRTELNIFGILLAVYGIHRWTSAPGRGLWAPRIVAVQIAWIAVAFVPTWYSLFATWAGISEPGQFRLSPTGLAQDIATIYTRKPGRVVFAPRAHVAVRKPLFNTLGLGMNQLPTLGVPVVSAVVQGITTDDLCPTYATLEGGIVAEAATVRSKAFLDVLGIRYVIALDDETVAAGLRQIRRLSDDLRLYENSDAWPQAFFVDAIPTDRVPRLAACPHDRFLCADFSKYALSRRPDDLEIARLYDGLRLTFSPADAARHVVITQWYRSGWTVTEGRASITRAADQLLGITVEPGQQAVTIRYRPRLRGTLFAMGIGTEIAVVVAIAALVLALRARRNHEQRAASGERQAGANQRVLDSHGVVTQAIEERRDIE
jgi:hypothetical protein